MKKSYLFTAGLAAVLLAVPSLASAVEYGGVGGRPANPQAGNPRTRSIFIYSLKPGQQASDGVTVYNNTGKQRTISVQAVDSVLSSGGAFACAQNADPRADVGSWIGLQTKSITLPANGSQVVPFTVTVPSKTSVGEHDGCITIQDTAMTSAPNGRKGVVLGFRSAIRVVVTIPGKIVKKLSLVSVNVGKLSNGNYQVAPLARNDGNVSLDTDVQVTLDSVLGVKSGNKGGTYPVLPRSKAGWNFEFKPPFWGGWYRANATATYNANPEAGLGQNRGGSKTVKLASGVFFAAPSAAASVIELLVLAAIAAAIAWFVRKRRDIRHIREHWRNYTVKQGDTVTEIAKKHHTAWKTLARVNGLKPPYNLQKGQKLKVPPKRKV